MGPDAAIAVQFFYKRGLKSSASVRTHTHTHTNTLHKTCLHNNNRVVGAIQLPRMRDNH